MLVLSRSYNYAVAGKIVKIPVGVFSQKQFVYKAIAVLEETAVEADEPQSLIKQDFPNLFLDFPRGPQTLNYNRLCNALKDKDKLAVNNVNGEAQYVIWQTEINAMMPQPSFTVAGDEETLAEAVEPPAEEEPVGGVTQPTLL